MARMSLGGKMSQNRLSLSLILAIRSEAFSAIKANCSANVALADAIETLDASLQHATVERSIDEQQQLVNAARHLATLMESGGA